MFPQEVFLTSLLASLAKVFFTTYDLSDQKKKKKDLNFIGKISFGLKNFIPVHHSFLTQYD